MLFISEKSSIDPNFSRINLSCFASVLLFSKEILVEADQNAVASGENTIQEYYLARHKKIDHSHAFLLFS